jgi:hypothetical protein
MIVDYYSLLTKAVAGKDAAARHKIYQDAHDLVAKSRLSREATSSHIAALEDAVRRIEDDIAAEQPREADAAAINEVLSTRSRSKPLIIGACAVVAVIAASALLYGYVARKGPGIVAGITAPSRKRSAVAKRPSWRTSRPVSMAVPRGRAFRLRCNGK